LALNVIFDVKGYEDRLDPLVETVFFRVTQEALTNISRHANTNQARVTFECFSKDARLLIQDEGVGFDPAIIEQPGAGLGVAGMRERVRSVNGEFVLKSSPGEGTIIEVEVPCLETK